jgi:hypothetical protein
MNDSAPVAAACRDTVSRRDFLRVGGLSVMALTVAEQAALAQSTARAPWRNCILLLMTGGPSQLETFDPKPEAPIDIRGPLRAIPTAVPGMLLSESLPRLAQRADRFSLLRSLAHDAAPIHETGLQLLQTGRLSARGERSPHFGSAAASHHGPRAAAPTSVVIPSLLADTGVNVWQGQGAGRLGTQFEPVVVPSGERPDWMTVSSNAASNTAAPLKGPHTASRKSRTAPLRTRRSGSAPAVAARPRREAHPEAALQRYGDTRFGTLCLEARRLVEAGVRCVTVNLFDRLNGETTWDCHGRGPWSPATVYDYRDTLCPQFDLAVSALLDDLSDSGLLEDTLVVATGEFGRTPNVNEFGGRDHWPHCWSALVAGGGVHGGRVFGASDARAAYPLDNPVSPASLHATMLQSLGIAAARPEPPEANGDTPAANDAPAPLAELFI